FFSVSGSSVIFSLSLHDALPICFGDLVELDLEREARLHAAVPALRAACRLVRVHARRIEAVRAERVRGGEQLARVVRGDQAERRDRKSTRLNSSHVKISYAVFCF